MLANQARRFGEVLVDRHVLSRDDLEVAIGRAEGPVDEPQAEPLDVDSLG